MAVELERLVESRVEDRLGKLESDVGHLQRDVTEIKADLRLFRSETNARLDKLAERATVEKMAARLEQTADRATVEKMAANLEKLTETVAALQERVTRGDLETRIWMFVMLSAVLTVMAHGFKWI